MSDREVSEMRKVIGIVIGLTAVAIGMLAVAICAVIVALPRE